MGKKIDAEELYHRMYEEAFEKDSDLQKWDSGCWIRFKLFENVLKDMPEVEEKTGHWTKKDVDFNGRVWHNCSICNGVAMTGADDNFFNFCPHCGAKMERG